MVGETEDRPVTRSRNGTKWHGEHRGTSHEGARKGMKAEGYNQGVISKAVDLELLPGARNAIRVCLNVQPTERVTVITDRECEEIAASLVHEIEQVGAQYRAVRARGCCRPGRSPGFRPRSPRTWNAARSASLPCTCSQRAPLAHGDDRHRQSPAHASCAHGEHQPADHARRACAPTTTRSTG